MRENVLIVVPGWCRVLHVGKPVDPSAADGLDAFEKIQEAQALYEDYLVITKDAELATLRELASGRSSGGGAPEAVFEPQPLKISLRSTR